MLTEKDLAIQAHKSPKVTIEFYPRTSASGKEKTAYFGVLTIDGKVCPISHCDEIPKALAVGAAELSAHYLDNAEIVFTPF